MANFMYLREAETFEEFTAQLADLQHERVVATRGPGGMWRGVAQIQLVNPDPEAFVVREPANGDL